MNDAAIRGETLVRERLEEQSLLERLHISPDVQAHMHVLAARTGARVETVMICEGIVSEEQLYRAIAAHFGLPFLEQLPPEQMRDSEALDLMLKLPHAVRLQDANAAARTVLVPQIGRLLLLRNRLDAAPGLRQRLAVTTPSAMRQAVWICGERRRVQAGTEILERAMPDYSARLTMTGRQGFWLGAITMGTLVGFGFAAASTSFAAHIVLSCFYLLILLFRLFAHTLQPAVQIDEDDDIDDPVPVYTVLVALYREAEIVPQLVEALQRIDWPKSRLDIKLVCEASDPDTLAALAREALPPYMSVVSVPDAAPKTKPKALNYALAGACGDFVTIYDAEDRPHPGQLKQAYRQFRNSGAELACLQAPLEISNGRASWLSGLFAADYAIYFRRILPFLAANGLPVPLGGTSNHFRREALERCGGWDPYNVTEDADLGLRLRRFGYRVGTLTLPTLEDAPTKPAIWIRQRTRWFKGWLQTFLVSMRHPVRLLMEIGPAGFCSYLLNTCGMLAAALFHPLLFTSAVTVTWRLVVPDARPFSGLELVMIPWDYTNLFLSYAYFAAAGVFSVRSGKIRLLFRQTIMIPVYWMMLSAAAWLALFELYRKPHFWAKTPHQATAKPGED